MRPARHVQAAASLVVSALWLSMVIVVMLCGVAAMCSSIATAALDQIASSQRHETLPTETSEPTQIKVAIPVPVVGKVIEDRVNLRTAPSTDAEVIGKLEKDDQITLIGRTEDGKWYQTRVEGTFKPGWIFGQTLEIISSDPATLPVAEPSNP